MVGDPERLNQLLITSKQVLLDCALDNGAVIAANSDFASYPKNATNYRYVWPRDAAFILRALEALGQSRTENFANWLLERAEDFKTSGLFCRRYATNGAASHSHDELQPDQSGALLWTFCESSSFVASDQLKQVVVIVANSLVDSWESNNFVKATYDLWEHHSGEGLDGAFSYTLASCIKGLSLASQRHPNPEPSWAETSSAMQRVLETDQALYYSRANGTDLRLDASLFGLAWPFVVVKDTPKLKQTLVALNSQLFKDGGFIRFVGDPYDGETLHGVDSNRGAGTWPLLSLWAVLANLALDDKAQAEQLFSNLVDQLSDNYLPEQLFHDGRVGVKPLGWAHAMFILAADSLGHPLPS